MDGSKLGLFEVLGALEMDGSKLGPLEVLGALEMDVSKLGYIIHVNEKIH